MSERQSIVAAKVEDRSPSMVEVIRGMPPQASTSGERAERGTTCFFLQFACPASAMHFGAVKPLLPLLW
jgi:hypothetical protein